MAALDTNVLVRYIVEDDPAQFAAAKRLIRRCVSEGQSLYVPVTVSLELEWVLRSNFGFSKESVTQTMSMLLSLVELSFESERALEIALSLYKKSSADYSDCVHIALAAQAGEQPLWTFDKATAKASGAQLVAP